MTHADSTTGYDVETCKRRLEEDQQPTPNRRLDDITGLDDLVEKARQTIVTPHLAGEHAAAASLALFQSHGLDSAEAIPRAIAGELGSADYTVAKLNLRDRAGGREFQKPTRLATYLETLVSEQPSVLLLEGADMVQAQPGGPLYHRLRDLTHGAHAAVVLCISDDDPRHRRQRYDIGQFVDVSFTIPTPDKPRRQAILQDTLETAAADSGCAIDPDAVQYEDLADQLDGYDAEWIRRVAERAVTITVASQADQVTHDELTTAYEQVDAERPDSSNSRGGRQTQEPAEEFTVETPDVTFDDIGGLDATINRIQQIVTVRQEYSDIFNEANFSTSHGILLAGPPGTGKTMLAKGVANELDRPFLSVKGPELKHPLYGMTERKIRQLFETADEEAPCVVFFDEFDAIAANRDTVNHTATESQVAALLAELDGMEEREDILVLAATNRQDAIDDAVLRQGRFDEVIEVPVPDASGQADIFEVHAEPLPLADDVTSSWFVDISPDAMTGADIAGICKEAFHTAVSAAERRDEIEITREHVRSALDVICSSTQQESTPKEFQ